MFQIGPIQYMTPRDVIKEKIAVIRTTYKLALAHDGMPADTEIASFSDDNPHAKEYDRLMTEYLAYRKAHPTIL
jgi:hypothetical protein